MLAALLAWQLAVSAQPAGAAGSTVDLYRDLQVLLSNPCNGEAVLVTVKGIFRFDAAGNIQQVVLTNAKGVGLTSGRSYVVAYAWVIAGPRAFHLSHQLVGV